MSGKKQSSTLLLIALCLHTLLYLPMWSRLVSSWSYKPQCSHGYFILPISLWLCVRRFKTVPDMPISHNYPSLILFAGSMVVYLLGIIAGAETLTHASYMGSLAGLILSLGGLSLLKTVAFPYAFLLFMFPIPDYLYLAMTGSLKLLATKLSAASISALGIPVVREGNLIYLANFQLDVVEACSGMQSLISYLMIATLLAYFSEASVAKKGVLIASAVPVALLNNVLRITSTGILGEFFGMAAITGMPHMAVGFITFAVGLAILILIYLGIYRKNIEHHTMHT